MRAHHDTGGEPGGAIDRTEHPYALWEKRIHALMILLVRPPRSLMTVDQMRLGIEGLGQQEYDRLTYYERWLESITRHLLQSGVLTVDELGHKLAEIEARKEPTDDLSLRCG